MSNAGKIRFGLCCLFRHEPIKFRQITAKTLLSLERESQLSRLSEICLHNVLQVQHSLRFAAKHGIGAFRILSPLFPRYTHREVAYQLDDLSDAELIKQKFAEIRKFRKRHEIRLSFHPDQFNVLSSPGEEVIKNSERELAYHGMLAHLVEADIINIHAGGVYGDKESALQRLMDNINKMPATVRHRLSLENDDVSYTPADLLPVCEQLGIPMVYDVHHHRCLPDGLSVQEVTERVIALWQRLGKEPYFHVSSPKHGWESPNPKPHAEYIDPADFPACWKGVTATVDVEAKAKELAVLKLKNDLQLHNNTP